MENFAGNYKLVKNDNLIEYLTSIGVPEERAHINAENWPTVAISVSGKSITMKTDQPANFSTTYVLDQEIDEKLSNGTIIKTTTKLDGDKLIASSTGPRDFVGTKVYQFSSQELIVSLSSPNSSVTGKKIYKKL